MSQPYARRVTLLIIGCLVILLSVWWNIGSEVSRIQLERTPIVKVKLLNTKNSSLYNETSSSVLTYADAPAKMFLRPGDLPGYTGWARPSNTLAGSFVLPHCDGTAQIQQNWTCAVHCHHVQCKHGGSLFFVRAYGPAILPGLVTDRCNGTYDVTFLPFDAGIYTIEVVLAFSSHPPWSDFPVQHEQEYEGYLLPGFPLQVNVVDQQDNNNNNNTKRAPLTAMSSSKTELHSCNMSMLTETSTHSALASGRWVVRKMNMQEPYVANQSLSAEEATLERYQTGETSLGIDMEYVPTSCSLMPARAVKYPRTLDSCRKRSQEYNNDKNNTNTNTNRSLHVIFIGDSNFRLQQDMFDRFFGHKLKTTRITTEGGLVVTLPNIHKRLKELAVAATESTGTSATATDYFVIFNAGLHDLDKFCQKMWRKYRAPLIHNVSDVDFSCVQLYRESLTELVTAVAAFPARLRVWQTTTAGWPKWGNYGVAWPADVWQVLPTDPTAIAHWNNVAWEVVQPFSKEIAVMDAYWLTLSRPDHRESDRLNSLGKHLVHAGPQVYDVLMRKWAMMILQTICPGAW